MIHDKEEQIRSSLAKTLDYRKNIDDRIDSLMNFMTSSIEPKVCCLQSILTTILTKSPLDATFFALPCLFDEED